MLDEIPATTLIEWMAFYQLEPWGTEAEYLGHAVTASTLANINRGKHKPYKMEDFVPKFERKKATDPMQMVAIAEITTAALGGQDNRKGEP